MPISKSQLLSVLLGGVGALLLAGSLFANLLGFGTPGFGMRQLQGAALGVPKLHVMEESPHQSRARLGAPGRHVETLDRMQRHVRQVIAPWGLAIQKKFGVVTDRDQRTETGLAAVLKVTLGEEVGPEGLPAEHRVVDDRF